MLAMTTYCPRTALDNQEVHSRITKKKKKIGLRKKQKACVCGGGTTYIRIGSVGVAQLLVDGGKVLAVAAPRRVELDQDVL